MGLNKQKKVPCGFCFVEFAMKEDAQRAIDCLNLKELDKRKIRVDWDYGFKEGRQFGRGQSGGQVRDDMAKTEDEDRPKLGGGN
jgi:nuclear cap-binding protein subunit 2